MKTTHIFIVDTKTFKYHLEYLFAGTGAKDNVIDFNNGPDTSLNYASENNLVSLMADSQRVRKGDYVIFYLQQNAQEEIYEGKFFGIFKVKEAPSFLDNNDDRQFLKNDLQKSLTFRILIEPFEVYPTGVTEWEALDEIKYIQSPNQMLWSLIYRKLKGNRGNTMITIYESERLFKLIRDKNERKTLSGDRFTFDFTNKEIKKDSGVHNYTGRKENINILPRLVNKYNQRKAFETHLQAYIVQNIGRDSNHSLDDSLLDNFQMEWLGNEVSCGIGMQRIDVMFSLINGEKRIVVPIELKAVEASEDNVFQIQRYVDWLDQYYIPNRISDIQPALVAKKISNKDNSLYSEIIKTFKDFNKKNKRCFPLKYIEYALADGKLKFELISY